MTAKLPLATWTDNEFVGDPETIRKWSRLRIGMEVTVMKRQSNGTDRAVYDAVVIESPARRPWIAVEAIWTTPKINEAGLEFVPGDRLLELFSPVHPFNAFAVTSPEGVHRGWYGNVTYPTFLLPRTAKPILVWHDLVLDSIILPGQEPILLDDDELPDATILGEGPGLRAALPIVRDGLISFIQALEQKRLANEG